MGNLSNRFLERLKTGPPLLLDAAMGTELQRSRFSEEDFRGERFKDWKQDVNGNNDLLILTQPDAVRSVHLGVYQITPRNSTDVSGEGINDTSSRAKDVTAVVSVTFAVNR